MVSKQEQGQAAPRREEVIAALLSFIEKTTAAADEYKQLQAQASLLGRGEPFAHDFRETVFMAAVAAGANTINDCLALVGGVPAAWIDRYNGQHMRGVIAGCKAFDQDTGTWNLEFRSPMYTGPIGVTPQRLSEIVLQSYPGS